MTKYIFVTGGVVSGLGKGITAASLGRLLKARGLKVAAQKLDPYINVDPGTMSRTSTVRFTSRRTAQRPTLTSVITRDLLMKTLTSIQTSQQVRSTGTCSTRSDAANTSAQRFR